jgi:hypothetical protein
MTFSFYVSSLLIREGRVLGRAADASVRLDAQAGSGCQSHAGAAKSHRNILLIAEGLDGIEARGARSGIEAGGEADKNGEADAEKNKP